MNTAISRHALSIETMIESLRSAELSKSGPVSAFDQARLSASVALLIHEGVTANVAATQELTAAFQQASRDLKTASAQTATTASRLNTFTMILAIATALLTFASGFQALQAKRQADLTE